MKRVLVETPYAGQHDDEVAANVDYARRCMKDSLRRGEAPLLSHLLYPQVLDDRIAEDRTLGIGAGFAWGEAAQLVAVYADRGISGGMRLGIERAERAGQAIEFRSLYETQETP